MEIGPGGEAKEAHTCLHLLWTHMDAGISTHVHTERARECVRVGASVCLLTAADARWTEDDLLMGDSMEHIEKETCSVGLSLSSGCLPPPLTSSAGALCCWRKAPHTHCIKPGCSASSPASLPHEWLPYCHILYGYCWQVTQSHWLEHGELTITKGGGVLVSVGSKAAMVVYP